MLVLLGLAMTAAPRPGDAHHSTANFDTSKTVTVTGTVTYFAFTNPHSYFDMDVKDAKGKVQAYKIFTLARVVMMRNGWGPGDLKAGDTVTISGNPDHQNPTYMYLLTVKFANGREWNRNSAY
jgi:hypothetical protein